MNNREYYRENRKEKDRDNKFQKNKRAPFRPRMSPRFQSTKDLKIDYKNISTLQKFLNDRGKIIPRRISGLSAKDQRHLTTSIKRARFLALITTGSIKR